MAGLAAVTLEGVLRAPIGSIPVPEGFNLYQSLVGMYRVAVILDDTDDVSAGLWLKMEGLRNYVQLVPKLPTDDRAAQYRRLQAVGGIELLVDPDPEAVAAGMEMGITSMLFGHPRAQRPEWRPDYDRSPRPWGALVAQVEETRRVRADEPVPQ